jgi:hypothetical protein
VGIDVLAEVRWGRREIVVGQMPCFVDMLGSERRRRSLVELLVELLACYCQRC